MRPRTVVCGLLAIVAVGFAGCNTSMPAGDPANPTQTSDGVASNNSQGANNNNSNAGAGNSVGATLLEQLSLERINRARLRPGSEAAQNGIAIDEGIPGALNVVPKQAVALNSLLYRSAQGHSQDMLDRDYFQHVSPNGVTPDQRIAATGYVASRRGENLAWRGTTGTVNEVEFVESEHRDLFVDTTVPSRGHRITMLEGTFREVGISILRGKFKEGGTDFDAIMQTQDYGTSAGSGTIVLGVVYNDSNNNNRYDFGEGMGNATVTFNDNTKSTNAGGGYSFEVKQAGSYTLKFPSYGRSQPVVITPGAPNIKLDLVNGVNIVVNLGIGLLN